jgi:hypothetical protein
MTHRHRARIYAGVALAVVLLVLNATSAFSEASGEQINAEVKACVEAVNAQALKENPRITYRFDAYYNAATSSIHNNLDQLGYVPQRAYLFAFEKCMAERGFPLGKKD